VDKLLAPKTHLQVSHGSVEGIIAQAAFFVQEFSRLAISRWGKQAIVEALLQFLEKKKTSGWETFKYVCTLANQVLH